MIYTVFPKDDDPWGQMPQDFSTYTEAKEYAEWLREKGYESDIESTEGEVI